MTLGVGLRALAAAIALAALIDPVFTRVLPQRENVTVVAMNDASLAAAVRVRDGLADRAEVTTTMAHAASAAAVCPAVGDCIIVTNGAAPRRVTAGARLLGVLRVDDEADGPEFADIVTPAAIHRDAAATLRLTTTRPVQRIEIFDGDTLVGSAEPDRSTTVDVPWVPIADGARVLRVTADQASSHVGVVVESKAAPVLVYEPQATWLGTFVRRALEDDTRFTVRGRARLAPPVAVTRGGMSTLSVAALEESRTVVVTAPELLDSAEVDLLERFVTRRGGSLIVLSDRRPSGAALRLLPPILGERREPQPQPVGRLRASEWVTFAAPPGTATLAAVDDAPVIVSRALGRGRVIVSGALDAWRYRQLSERFDSFWTALAWEASIAAGPLLRVETDRVIAEPGEEVTVSVERQQLTDNVEAADEVVASGRVVCGDERHLLRLWPGARAGSFSASFRIDRAGACTVSVAVGDLAATAAVTIRDDLRRVSRHDHRLEAIAAAHGAPLVTSGRESELVAHVRQQLSSRHESAPYWPMRSPYWLIPFVISLSAEWWLRRRSGLS